MKKVNKKAILAMLVAMVMSLGMMGGINGKSQDSNLQQWGVCAYVAGKSAESTLGKTIANTATAVFAGGAGEIIVSGMIAGGPMGWGAALIFGTVVGL